MTVYFLFAVAQLSIGLEFIENQFINTWQFCDSHEMVLNSVTLTVDETVYHYSEKMMERSKIEYSEDLEVRIKEKDLPTIQIEYPKLEKSIKAGQGKVKYPNIVQRISAGFKKPIIVILTVRMNEENRVISLSEGEISVELKSRQLDFNFTGTGRLNSSNVTLPIAGHLKLDL